jgi:predicted Zn-dependent protease
MEKSRTEMISDSRIEETIKHAIESHANGQTSLAVQELSALAAEFPTEARVHGYLATFLWRSDRFDEALEPARQASLLSPGSERASLVLFHLLWKIGQRVEAREEMKRFLKVSPSEEYSKMIKEWNLSEGDLPDIG